jgi:hypothetical protein
MSDGIEIGDPWVAEVLATDVSFLRQSVSHDPANDTYGDCFRTCIACLIGADDPTAVPHFAADNIAKHGDIDKPGWADLRDARFWLRVTYDLDIFPLSLPVADEMGVHYMATVLSPAGVHHSVIAKQGRVVWCPAGHDTEHMAMLPDESAWVISRPWHPTPDVMVDEWRAADAEGQP